MNIMPVRHYKTPSYPDKETIYHNPNALKTVPQRWKTNIYACTALSATLAMILSGCSSQQSSTNSDSDTSTANSCPINSENYSFPKSSFAASMLSSTAKNSAASATSSTITYPPLIKSRKSNAPLEIPPIPLFEHGYGRGSFGCMSEAPPSYLSEEDALKLINEYAKEEGIEFSLTEPYTLNLYVPNFNLAYYKEATDSNNVLVTGYTIKDFTVDGYNKNLKISFEYISEKDYVSMADKTKVYNPGVTYYYTEGARAVNDQLNKYRDEVITATFYDPVYNIEEYWDQNYNIDEQAVSKAVKQDLKLQVKDFIQWLKSQNII